PAQSRFNWADSICDIISVEAIPHLKSQRISRSQTDRLDVEVFSRLKNGIPNVLGVGIFHVDLKSSRTGITCAGDDHILYACKFSDREVIKLHFRKINRSQGLYCRDGL